MTSVEILFAAGQGSGAPFKGNPWVDITHEDFTGTSDPTTVTDWLSAWNAAKSFAGTTYPLFIPPKATPYNFSAFKFPSAGTILALPGTAVLQMDSATSSSTTWADVPSTSGGTNVFVNHDLYIDGLTFDGGLTSSNYTGGTDNLGTGQGIDRSQQLVRFASVDKLTLLNCTFQHCAGQLVSVSGCRDVTADNIQIIDWGHPMRQATLEATGMTNSQTYIDVDSTTYADKLPNFNTLASGSYYRAVRIDGEICWVVSETAGGGVGGSKRLNLGASPDYNPGVQGTNTGRNYIHPTVGYGSNGGAVAHAGGARVACNEVSGGPGFAFAGSFTGGDQTPTTRVKASNFDAYGGRWGACYPNAQDAEFTNFTFYDHFEGSFWFNDNDGTTPWREARGVRIAGVSVSGTSRRSIQNVAAEISGTDVEITGFKVEGTDGAGLFVKSTAQSVNVHHNEVWDCLQEQATFPPFLDYGQITVLQGAGIQQKDVTISHNKIGRNGTTPASKYAIAVRASDAGAYKHLRVYKNEMDYGYTVQPTKVSVSTIIDTTETLDLDHDLDYVARLRNRLRMVDRDATPVADRDFQVIDGLLRAANTSGVEGRYISKASIEQLTESDITSLVSDLAGKQPLDTDLTEIAGEANVRGDLLYTDSGPNWKRLALGTSGQYLGTDGTDVLWRAQSTLDHGSIGGLADDDHSQYLLLAGRNTGQTAIGGTANADNLTLQATTNTTYDATHGKVRLDDLIECLPTDRSFTGATPSLLRWNGTITLNPASNAAIRAVDFTATVKNDVAGSAFGNGFLFNAQGVLVNVSGEANNPGPWFTLNSAMTIRSDAQTLTMATSRDVQANTTFDFINRTAETFTITEYTHYWARGSVKTGCTVTTRRGLWFQALATATGTLVNNLAIDIDDLTQGTTINSSLRSLGAAVDMRHAGPALFGATGAPNANLSLDCAGGFATRKQDLTLSNGANNDIAVTGSLVRITGPTGAYNITSIANPVDGKVVTLVDTTNQALTITNAAATGTAANRIVTSTNADLVGTAANQTVCVLVYDATTARWRDISFRA